jgi:hypothetical protein
MFAGMASKPSLPWSTSAMATRSHSMVGRQVEPMNLIPLSGDLKSEDSVLEWMTDDDNRELEDEIEAVNFRMLDKLLETSSLIAVFFCMYHGRTMT